MQPNDFFHRTALAQRLADELLSSDGSSGLFITGPRRTGKSTFIREDLIPALSARGGQGGGGCQVVYADLWDDRAANPGDVIVAAIRAELLKFDGFVLRAAKGVGLDKIKVGGLEMSLDHIGFGKGETLTKALTLLAAASKKGIVLIIDEAQQSQATEAGRQALYALKAARDALNASAGPGFRLLATGSSSDKLAALVDDKDQAFYQAPLQPLPTLGSDYLAWVHSKLRFDPRPSPASLARAFDACNHRPEPLRGVLRELALVTDVSAPDIDARFEAMVSANLARAKHSVVRQINGLMPLDAAVLKVMAQTGKQFAPYSKAAYAQYKALMQASTGEPAGPVNQSAVQGALERLRADKFIWRAGRGAYLIEDPQHLGWIRDLAQDDGSAKD